MTERPGQPPLFRTATAVAKLGAGTDDRGAAGQHAVWSGAIAPGWDIAANANGGYLLAIAARALSAALDRPDPVTISAHYLSPGRPGAVTIRTQVIKQGRSLGSGTAVLLAGERPLLSCIGTFGELSATAEPQAMDHTPPVMPDPDDCLPVVASGTFPPPFMEKVELRLHPEDGQFLRGDHSGQALMRGWFRLRGSEPADTIALLCAADAFPPTAFNAGLPVAWTPTIELTVHVRARPQPGWLRCAFATHFVTGGFLEEDGEIWDPAGRLVAQSRQLALVPRAELGPGGTRSGTFGAGQRDQPAQMPRGVAADDRRHVPPAERQAAGAESAQPAAERDDRRGRDHLGGGGRPHEGCALADDRPDVGQAERLGPELVGHPLHERGVRGDLVDRERAGQRKDRHRGGETRVEDGQRQHGAGAHGHRPHPA